MQNDVNRGEQRSGMRVRIVVALMVCLILLLLLALYFSKLLRQDVQSGSVLGFTMKGGEMTSRMRINLLKAVELEKSAFMAITDGESKTFADQSHMTADTVERDFQELKGLIDKEVKGRGSEVAQRIRECWKNFREIDRELLQLSVENTNIKASHLSYTEGAEAMGRFERALDQMMVIRSSAAKEARITKLAYRAVTAAFTIYNLQSPHIDEAQDTKMDEMESVMKANEEKVRSSFNDLKHLVDRRGRTFLDAASLAFEEFMKVNSEVVRLSRINSNIKSLDLSLGRKRKVAAQCEETLNSMQETIRGRTFKATR